jgi:hypothetical protein
MVLPAIALTTLWWCIGMPMMLFLAALQQVPQTLRGRRAGQHQPLAQLTPSPCRLIRHTGDPGRGHRSDRCSSSCSARPSC